MKTVLFQALLRSTQSLTRSQRERLHRHLKAEHSAQESQRALSGYEPKRCPHCQTGRLVRNGVQNGVQRFRCTAQGCKKSVRATSDSPLNRLRAKDKLAAYADCLREGLTVRETADRMGFSVSRAFRWRHRFLRKPVKHQPQALSGVVEIDETYFRRSYKGSRWRGSKARTRGGNASTTGRLASEWVPVLIGRARGRPHVIDRLLKKMTARAVDATLAKAIDRENVVVCADSLPAFKGLGSRLGVRCDLLVQGQPAPKSVHVQSVNAYHERLQTWINRDLRGVATKYLPNYLAWHRLRGWNQQGLTAPEFIGSALGHQIINR